MRASTPLWTPLAVEGAPLPERVDITVVGDGLAGLAVALFLAEGGAQVCLLCPDDTVGSGLLGREPGLVFTGLAEPPDRLVLSVGEARATELLRFSAASVRLARELGLARSTGGLHAALGTDEEASMAPAARVLEDAGIEVEIWEAEAVNAALGSTGFGRGRYLAGDGLADPEAAFEILWDRLGRAGVIRCTGQTVEEVDTSGGRGTVRIGDQRVKSELIVLTGGFELARLDPWFSDKLTPVRTQLLATAPRALGPLPLGFSAQLGYLFGRGSSDGRLVLGGCRWATPHLETWETDDSVIVDLVDARLRAASQRHFPGAAEAASAAALLHLALPSGGPLPGRARLATCVAFNGRPWSLALRCARALADGLLTGRPEGLPAMMRSDRFL